MVGSVECALGTKTKPNELVRHGCVVLLAAAALLSSPPVWSQDSSDWWQAEGWPAVFRLRDCVAEYADRDAAQRAQDEKWSALLIAAIDGDCRSAFDGMIQLFAQHIDAQDIELQLRTITDTTLLPALKAKRDGSTASGEENPVSSMPERVLTSRIVAPDSTAGRRGLQSPARAHGGSPAKFSQEWLDHCRAKYNSFNPQTGKYRSYGGVYRSCR
jgi:hypothetical protein